MLSQPQFDGALPRLNNILANGLCCDTDTLLCESNYIAHVGRHKYITTTISYTTETDHCKVAFTISYHENYLSPVCFYRLWKNGAIQFDGQGAGSSEVIASLQSHHILGEPWMMIHPCDDERAISQFLGSGYSPIDWMVTWFGVRGIPSVMKDISFRVSGQLLQNESP